MENITIQKVTLNHLEALQQISKQTFAETYSAGNTEENIRRHLEEGFSRPKLASELNDPNMEFYFAMLGDKITGYIKLNFGPTQTELQDDEAVELERIYVLQAFQGRKIGQLLCEKAIEVARQKNAGYVWLGVWEENPKAIRFYQKNGFVAFNKHIFKLGNDPQTDLMMKLSLKDDERD